MKVSLTIRSAHHYLRNNCIIFTWLRILHLSWSTRQFRVLCLLRVRTHYVLHTCWLMWRTRVEIVRIKIVMNGMTIPETYITIISWVTWWRWRKVMRPSWKHATQHPHVILLWTTRRQRLTLDTRSSSVSRWERNWLGSWLVEERFCTVSRCSLLIELSVAVKCIHTCFTALLSRLLSIRKRCYRLVLSLLKVRHIKSVRISFSFHLICMIFREMLGRSWKTRSRRIKRRSS